MTDDFWKRKSLAEMSIAEWGTVEARQSAINELAANVQAYLAGEERNRVV